MIARRLKDFFWRNIHDIVDSTVLELLESDELTLIGQFLSARDEDTRKDFADRLMMRTLHNIDPSFPVFWRLFEQALHKLGAMEEGVAYVKESYRSHYTHSTNVYLLGLYLLQEKLLGRRYLDHLNLNYFDTHAEAHWASRPYTRSGPEEKKEFQKRWALAAFFHDLAYPSEINLKVMQAEGERVVGTKRPYSLTIPNLDSLLTSFVMPEIKKSAQPASAPSYLFCEDLLETLSHRMVNRIGPYSANLIYKSMKEEITKGFKEGFFEHGLMGAIFLLQDFFSILYTCYCDEPKVRKYGLSPWEKHNIAMNITRFTDAMTAISLHNIKKFEAGVFNPGNKIKINNTKMPLTFLLILCDELQVWDREIEPWDGKSPFITIRDQKDKTLNKSMFIDHYTRLYEDFLNCTANEEEMELIIPFGELDEKKKESERTFKELITEETITYKIYKVEKNSSIEKAYTIKFKTIPLYYLQPFLKGITPGTPEYKFREKLIVEMQKEALETFKLKHKTIGTLLQLTIDLKSFLNLHRLQLTERADSVKDKILPHITALKKSQEKLFPHFRPYHTHDLCPVKSEETDLQIPENIDMLGLNYPGEEALNIHRVIAECLEEDKDEVVKKDQMYITFFRPIITALNKRITNEIIPRIEEYVYGILRETYIATKNKAGLMAKKEKL